MSNIGLFKKLLILTAFVSLITSCKDGVIRGHKIVDIKYCVSVCMQSTFEIFHSNGRSWGTGSSSMNGLSQGNIFDRVEKHCKDFYKDEKCCNNKYENELMSTFHDYDYGVCLNLGEVLDE